jgi:hypothetical protein
VVVLLVACTAPPRPVTEHPRHAERPYLKLIEPDNEWTLPISVASGHFGAGGYQRETETHGSVHCAIKQLDHIGEAAVARLACDKPYDDLSITGTWVAQPAGLYHPLGPITQPDDLATLVDDDLLINDVPRERDHSHTTDSATRTVSAAPLGHGWCVQDKIVAAALASHEQGDRRSFTLCFDAATGIVSASEYDTVTSDASWRSVQVGKDPQLDSDDPLYPEGNATCPRGSSCEE